MKMNFNNDIKSRENVRQNETKQIYTNKKDSKSSEKPLKGNKGGKTSGNKEDVPLLKD